MKLAWRLAGNDKEGQFEPSNDDHESTETALGSFPGQCNKCKK